MTSAMLRTSVALAICCFSGCATYRQPFTCTVPTVAREWPTIRPVTQEPGRFELKVLDGAEAKFERRVQATAEAIPISTFATRLGELLAQPVSVSQDVMDARVSVAGTLSLKQLFELLKTSHVWVRGTDVLEFLSEREALLRRERMLEVVPFSTAIIELKHPELAHQLAAMSCASLLGPGGSASVVGKVLIVRDLNSISKVQKAVATLDAR